MATYYVNSATGSDSNNGLSTGAAKATIQAAANLTVAGDIVNIMPGNGYGGGSGGVGVLGISRSGSTGNPITYQGFQGIPVLNSDQNYNGIIDIEADFITVQNLELAGHNALLVNPVSGCWALQWAGTAGNFPTGSAYNGSGVKIGAHNNIQIIGCNIHDMPASGISASGGGDWISCQSNTINGNCKYSPWGTSGISIFAPTGDGTTTTHIFLERNIIYDNRMLVGAGNNPAGAHPVAATTNGTTAAGSRVLHFASTTGINIGTLAFDTTATGAITNGTTVVSIVANTSVTLSANVNSPGVGSGDHVMFADCTDGEGIILDTFNTQPYVARTLVRNNLVFNNGSGGIFNIGSDHVDINFNTCYLNGSGFNNPGAGLGEISTYWGSGTDSNVFNNLILASSVYPRGNNSGVNVSTWGFNLGFGGDASGLPGSNTITTNPLLVNPSIAAPPGNNLNITLGSPARNAASGSWTRAVDILGNPGQVGSASDLGCYEFRNIGYSRHRR